MLTRGGVRSGRAGKGAIGVCISPSAEAACVVMSNVVRPRVVKVFRRDGLFRAEYNAYRRGYMRKRRVRVVRGVMRSEVLECFLKGV